MAAAPFARISEPILPPGVATWLRDVKASADEVHMSLIALQELVAAFAPWNSVLSRFSSLSIQLSKLYGLVFDAGGPDAEEDTATTRARDLCRKLLLKPQLGPQGLLSADIFRSSKDFIEVTEKLKQALTEAVAVFGDFGLGQASAEADAHGKKAGVDGDDFGGFGDNEEDDVAMGGTLEEPGNDRKGVFLVMDHIDEYNREVLSLKQLALMHRQMAANNSAAASLPPEDAEGGRVRSSQLIHDTLVSQLNSIQFGHRLR